MKILPKQKLVRDLLMLTARSGPNRFPGSKAQPQDFIKGWPETEIWDESDGTLRGWYGSHGGNRFSSWRDGNSCLGSWQVLVKVQQVDPSLASTVLALANVFFWIQNLAFWLNFTHEYCRTMFSRELELLTKCCHSGALTLKTMRLCLVTHIQSCTATLRTDPRS